MRGFTAFVVLTATIALALSVTLATAAEQSRIEPPIPTASHDGVLISSSGVSFKAAATDTFCLYGGPGSSLGKFQDESGTLPDDQGWVGVDVTEQFPLWQRSTFNAANLNGNGPGNHAMWAGQTAEQQPGWVTAPGYGNSWNAILQFEAPMVDPSVGQVVGLDFFFNHNSEPFYDYFKVAYGRNSLIRNVFSIDGSNRDPSGVFHPPGVQFSLQGGQPIQYGSNDYPDGNIVIQMAATSDPAWSSEDGLWPSVGGLAEVDDITVTYNDGAGRTNVVFEDFEGPGPYAWEPLRAPYAGYFGKVFSRVEDIDPCRSNRSPMYGFIDDGTGPFNASYTGTGTGGTTSLNWNYGVPGGYVVNYNGGVSFGLLGLHNEILSPEIAWDLPGTADDGLQGARIRASVWNHLPFLNGLAYQWSVRGRDTGSGQWSSWADRGFAYGTGAAQWLNLDLDVTDLLPASKDLVQMRLAVIDRCFLIEFCNLDATPAPLFDNAAFLKYDVGGPMITTRTIDLFQDSFAQSGETDVSTQAGRDAMDVRVDMARDVSTGAQNTPGDSIIVDVTSIIPGATIDITNIKVVWGLHKNPFFEDALRSNLIATSTVVRPGTDPSPGFWEFRTGEVAAQQSTTSAGFPIPDRYFFDLPDVDFMYPGDVLIYYIEATDSAGNTTTIPADVSGFDGHVFNNSVIYDPAFRIRAMPTFYSWTGDPTVRQPEILVINDLGHLGGETTLFHALGQSSRSWAGIDYDLYTVKGPSSAVSNGIGSSGAHGATPDQLSGYELVIYVAGNLSSRLLSDGSNLGGNDKGDDLGTLTGWHGQAGPRAAAYFGDAIASAHSTLGQGSAAGDTYLSTIMGVVLNDADVRDEIGGQTAPAVRPTGSYVWFPVGSPEFVAYGGCLAINTFDSITPGPGAVKGHEFVSTPAASAAASVIWERMESGFRKVDLTFPYGLTYVWNRPEDAGLFSARSELMSYIMDIGGAFAQGEPVAAEDAPARFQVEQAFPNPFNPSTTIAFTVPTPGRVLAQVYNIRGERVATLANEDFPAGPHELIWRGQDANGASVASGVYVVQISGFGRTERQKLVLLK